MCRTIIGFLVALFSSSVLGAALEASETDTEEWIAIREAGVKSYLAASYAEALTAFEKCWPFAQTPLTRGTTAGDIASALHALGREAEALPWFERAVGIWQAAPDRRDELARASLGLADVYWSLSDLQAAEQTLRAAIRAKPRADFEAGLKNRLADMLREQGRNGEARQLLLEALELPGVSHPYQADSWLGIADLDRRTKRWNESLAEWNKALSLARQEGAATIEALALQGIGLIYLNRGYLSRAEPLLRNSMTLLEKDPRTPPQQIANALGCIASLYFENRKYALAEDALLRAVAYLTKENGDERPQTAFLKESLAEAYSADKRFDKARQYAVEAHATMRHIFGDDSVSAAEALGTLGHIEQDRHNLTAAAADYESALNVMRRSQAVTDQRLYILLSRYASVLNDLHRKREATQLQTEIRSFRMK
jgi:tetratricopeptide (TPR) repeat protein